MIKVYRKISGVETEIYTLSAKQSEHKTAIRGLNEIQISITVDMMLPILEGDYIKLNGVNYTINRDVEYTIESDVKYSYDLVFEHPFYILLNKLYCNRITGHTSFTLTGKLRDFVELLVWCVNISPENPDGVDTGWTVGEIFNTEYKTLTFQDLYCNEVLNKLSDEFQVEYFFNNKQVNFVERIERLTDHVFEHGAGKGLYKLTQQNVDKEDTVTRLLVRGGNQNVPNGYADEEGYLKLPENYLEDFSEHAKVVERKKKFEEEFPRFVGSIATVSGENNKILTCPQIDFDIAAIAVGDNARINFLTGDLMGGPGYKFNWDNTNKQITLIDQEDETALADADGNKPIIPNANKKTKVGDQFNFTGVLMPASYVAASITRLREKGNKYLGLFSKKRVKFTLDIDHRYMRGKPELIVGDLVVISIPQRNFNQVIRITEIGKNLHTGAVSATVSNYLEENWEKYVESRVENVRNEILAKQANVRNTLESIFKDGIVTESELKSIEAILTNLSVERGQLNAQYLVVRGNVNLINKTPLETAWSNYQTAFVEVETAINNAIADKLVSDSEKANIDNKISVYSTRTNEFATALENARVAIEDNKNQGVLDVVDQNKQYLQDQIDGVVDNWFYPYSPTLANYPASDWTTNTIKDRHVGDTFTNTAQAPATDAGKSWRFVKNGSVYSWTQIADSDAVLALQKAAQAQSTADGKSTTYLIQPTSYKLGDMWVLAADQTVNGIAYKSGEILTATQDSTTYNQAHWVKKVRYTDDTKANQVAISLTNFTDTVFPQEKNQLQTQIDGKIETHFTATDPATAWTTADLKTKHTGDMWYNSTTKKLNRYSGSGWVLIEDQKAIDAFDTASTAKDVADGKRRVFTAIPTVPYDVGDLWAQGTDGDLMRCATAKTSSGSYSASDWVKASKYTDDTAVDNLQIGGVNLLDGTSDEWQSVSRPSSSYYSNVFYPNTELVPGQTYTFSWEAEWVSGATNMYINIGAGASTFERDIIFALKSTTHAFNRRSITFTPTEYQLALGNRFAFRWYNNLQDVSFRYRKLKLEIGSKVTDWDLSKRDRQSKIDSAKQEALTAAGNAQTSANTANTAVGNLNTYVDGSFKDGVIEASEAKAIEKYINVVNTEKSNLEATYNTLYDNTYLEGTPKTNLLNAKVTYFGAVNTLINSINTAITDGRTTVAEKQAVDTNYTSYKTALASLQTAIENANKAIQTKLDTLSTDKVNNLQIGAKNLLIGSKNYSLSNPLFTGSTATDSGMDENFWVLTLGSTYLQINIPSKVATGEKFTFSFIHTRRSFSEQNFQVSYGAENKTFTSNSNTTKSPFTFTKTADTYLRISRVDGGSGWTLRVDELQLEMGDKATGYSEATEDIQARIDAEKARINEILSDNIADPSEKQYLSNLWQEIYAEYPRIWAQANTYAIDKSNYESKYTALDNLLSPVLANLTVNSTVAGASIRTAFSQYYDARIFLQNAITNKVNQNAGDAKLTAEQAQLAADGYMRARYVRDWLKGNTDHNTNNWSEIKVVNKAGVNLALGLPANNISSNGTWHASYPKTSVIDGNTSTQGYIPQTTPTENYVQIDLGQIYHDIDYIGVWHAGWPTRLYYGTKTEISVDGVNWTPVFDSAKSGTYKETAAGNIISFRPNEVLAKVLKGAAVTDTFKTTINGGLISTVMILLRELNSIIETAGISGIQDDGYLPAYWSGGTYAEALAFSELMRAVDRGDNPIASATLNAKMSSIVMLHNGHAKVGELIIKSNGQIIILDKATGKIKFIINSQDIPSVAELMGGTAFGETKNNSSVLGISADTTLSETISVTKNNSNITFTASSLSLSAVLDNSRCSIAIQLFKDGVYYRDIRNVTLSGDGAMSNSISNIAITFTGCPIGIYSIRLIFSQSGLVLDRQASLSASVLKWDFTQSGVRYFQLGLNGLMAYYSDNHFHYTETGGFDLRGATNMPGILISGSVASGGGFSSSWGAKKHATLTAQKTATGTYTVYHSVGHSDYSVQITPETDQRVYYVPSANKGTSSFIVYFRNLAGTLSDSAFSFSINGKNYA